MSHKKLNEKEYQQLHEALNKFAADATSIKTEEVKLKKGLIKWLIKIVKRGLGSYYVETIYNAGSANEKLQAGEATDFDIMLFLKKGQLNKLNWEVKKKEHGFCTVKCGIQKGEYIKSYMHRLMDKEHYVSARKVRNWVTSKIDRVIRRHTPFVYPYNGQPIAQGVSERKTISLKVSRKSKGPSTTLLIEPEGDDFRPFTLDIVHSLRVKSGKSTYDVVAKPYDKQHPSSIEYERWWRISHSKAETEALQNIDKGNKIHRKMLRILKAMGKSQDQLSMLATYIYKNVILHEHRKGRDWTESQLAYRFVDTILSLRDYLKNENLPSFYDESINLLHAYKPVALQNLHCYLKRIANKGIEGYLKLLNTTVNKGIQSEVHLRDRRRKKRYRRMRKSLKTKPEETKEQHGKSGKQRDKNVKQETHDSDNSEEDVGLHENDDILEEERELYGYDGTDEEAEIYESFDGDEEDIEWLDDDHHEDEDVESFVSDDCYDWLLEGDMLESDEGEDY